MKRFSSDLDSSRFFSVKRPRDDRFDLAISTLVSQGIATPNQVFYNLRRYLAEPGHRDYFCQQGALTKLCSLLSLTADREKQASILEVLLTLAHHKASMVELGQSYIVQLFLMAEQGDTLGINQQAIRLLAALALHAAVNSDFYKPENIQRLEQLLVVNDDVVQTQAMETLLDLLQNDACRAVALSSTTIASLCRLHEQDDRVTEDNFLAIMMKLSMDKSNFSGIREAGAIPRLISCLHEHENTLKIILYLSQNMDNQAVIHANQGIEALVNLAISQKNIKPLGVICFLANNPEYRPGIAGKIPSQLIGELVRYIHLNTKSCSKSAFRLLCEMKLEAADLQTIRKNGGIHVLVKFLMDLDLRGQAAKILVELVKNSSSMQELLYANGMTHLRPLLTDDDSQTQHHATTLLQALQTHQQASTFKTIPYESLSFTAKILGQGGFGKVVQGQWLQHTPVAIKTLLKIGATQEDLQEFSDEGILHSSLSHPNIVALYGAYLAPGRYGLVLELLSDGSLSQVIERKRLTPVKRQVYAMDISRGLSYLNTQLIVHCDLKPQNILIGGGKAKLADFGSAVRLSSLSQLTTGQVSQVGTWCYAAPEVIQHNRASFASDVWSFSMVLWEMAIGDRPYKEFNETQVKQRVQNGIKPGTLLAVQEKTSKPYADLIGACWEARAERRPIIQSVAESVSNFPK